MSRRFSLAKTLSSAFLPSSEEKKDDDDGEIPSFLSSSLAPKVAAILEKHADKIHDDSFLKIVRQLEFWHASENLTDEEFLALAERLAKIASWREEVDDDSIPDEKKFQVPKVRFGQTELQMPIITCGGELDIGIIGYHFCPSYCSFYSLLSNMFLIANITITCM